MHRNLRSLLSWTLRSIGHQSRNSSAVTTASGDGIRFGIPPCAIDAVMKNRIGFEGRNERLNPQLRIVSRIHANMMPGHSIQECPSIYNGFDVGNGNIDGKYSGDEYGILPGVIKSYKFMGNPAFQIVTEYDCPETERERMTSDTDANIDGQLEQLEPVIRAKHRIIIRPNQHMNMLRIRSIKMNKHKLRKRRKKNLAMILKIRTKKEIRKEKLFRAELLSQIREAEKFDAKAYVQHVLSTIAKKPKEKSIWELKDEFYEKKRKHRSNVDLIKPKFDDPVP